MLHFTETLILIENILEITKNQISPSSFQYQSEGLKYFFKE